MTNKLISSIIFFAFLILAIGCGGGTNSSPSKIIVTAPNNNVSPEPISPIVVNPVPIIDTSTVSSKWNSDEDGDEIADNADNCPAIYNPKQLDTNSDGTGDSCTPVTVIENNGISTLRATIVTEYGAWLQYKGTRNTLYDSNYAVVFWSTNANDLNSTSKLQSIFTSTTSCQNLRSFDVNWQYSNAANCLKIRSTEDLNILRTEPVLLYDLAPGTQYYITVRYINNEATDIIDDQVGNVLDITTKPLTQWQLTGETHPRVFASDSMLTYWNTQRQNNEINFPGYLTSMRNEIKQVISGTDNYRFAHYCLPAATLFNLTGDTNDQTAAMSIFNMTLSHWQSADFTGDTYRFEEEALAYCTDGLWNILSNTQVNDAATEAIRDAKNALTRRRFSDTDQFVSLTRSFLVVGFTFCGETSRISAQNSTDACNILDEGFRRWYGTLLPMARKDSGYYANSGGYLPDGTSYEKGTMKYWLNSFWAFNNMGYDQSSYAPFLINNFLSAKVHSTTPSQLGYFATGDVQSYFNGGWDSGEPNTINHRPDFNSTNLLHAALLDRFGETEYANRIQKFIQKTTNAPIKDHQVFHRLMFEKPVSDNEYSLGLDTTFTESGYGIVFDRTDWSSSATYSVFTAGWRGVDHSAFDTGNLSIYRSGEWLFNHNTGYLGTSIQPESGNTPRYTIPNNGGVSPYIYIRPSDGESNMAINYISSELNYIVYNSTNNYKSTVENSYAYARVERAVVWFKNGISDDFVIIDYAKTNNSYTEANIELNVNLPSVNATFNSVNSNTADAITSNQKARITFSQKDGNGSYAIQDLAGIPDNFNPFDGVLYSDSVEYTAISPAPEIHSDIAIQIVDTADNFDTTQDIYLGTDREWKLKAIGDNLLLYPTGDLIAGTIPTINDSISLASSNYKKIVIIGLPKKQSFSFNLIEADVNSYNIQLTAGSGSETSQSSTNGMLIFNL